MANPDIANQNRRRAASWPVFRLGSRQVVVSLCSLLKRLSKKFCSAMVMSSKEGGLPESPFRSEDHSSRRCFPLRWPASLQHFQIRQLLLPVRPELCEERGQY